MGNGGKGGRLLGLSYPIAPDCTVPPHCHQIFKDACEMSCQAYARRPHCPPSGFVMPQLPGNLIGPPHRCYLFDRDQRLGGHLLQLNLSMQNRAIPGIKGRCNVRAMSPQNGPISSGFMARALNRTSTSAASSVAASTITPSAHNPRAADSSRGFELLQNCHPHVVEAGHEGATRDSPCQLSAARATSTILLQQAASIRGQTLLTLPSSSMQDSGNPSYPQQPCTMDPNLPLPTSLPDNTSLTAIARSVLRSATHVLLLLSAVLVPFIVSLSPSPKRMVGLSLDLAPTASAAMCQVTVYLP